MHEGEDERQSWGQGNYDLRKRAWPVINVAVMLLHKGALTTPICRSEGPDLLTVWYFRFLTRR